MKLTAKQRARFLARVRKEPDDGCWVWTGYCLHFGHGQVRLNGRNELTHRVAYELATGKPLGDICLLHKCDNPPCVRPSHMFKGTQIDNVKDMDAKGRRAKTAGAAHWTRQRSDVHDVMARGEAHGKAKLDDGKVRKVRQLLSAGESAAAIGRLLDVSKKAILLVKHGKTWRHVK